MNKTMRVRRPSAAVSVSVLALCVALGGTGYAASQLPAKSVGTKQLKSGAVTSAKVADHSLVAKDFAPGHEPVRQTGYFVQGPAAVAIGETFVEVAGASLPAGSYLVSGSTTLVNLGASEDLVLCAIRKGAVAPTAAHSAVVGKDPGSPDGEAITTMAVDGAVVLSATTRVSLVCLDDPAGATSSTSAENPQFTAIKVATLK